MMTKRQTIDEIMVINQSAEPEFLARFSDEQLNEYLEHLHVLHTPRLSGNPRRYDAYFENCPKVSSRPTKCPSDSPGQAADNQEAKQQPRQPGRPVPAGAQASPAENEYKPFAAEEDS
jgi:hypothetical protein